MKLLTKYNRVNIGVSLIILLASSITYYYIIRHILIEQLDRDLKVEEQEILDYISVKKQLPNSSAYKGQAITFEKQISSDFKRIFESKTVPDSLHREPVRMLSFPVTVNNERYKAIVIKSQVEAEYLLKLIVIITGGIFLFLLMLTAIINRFVLNKLWQPFYDTLHHLRNFNVTHPKPVNLPETAISEFNELNASVTEMTKKVSDEFQSLRTFADNASHEMQTPLAIISSKLDLLIQKSTGEQTEHIQAIYNATNRLSKLNQTLLLLTKIDNNQYIHNDTIDFKELLQQKFQQFEELISARRIKVSNSLEQICVTVNKDLADIMLNNLLSNAIRHNYNGGYIDCILTPEKLSLLNSGPDLMFNTKDIFNRFQKSDYSDGTGLGLAVVKQICDLYNFSVSYNNSEHEHMFTVYLK